MRDELEKEVMTVAVAILATRGLLQKEMAGILHMSQPEISRYRTRAEESGYLAPLELREDLVEPERLSAAMSLVNRESLARELQQYCNQFLKPSPLTRIVVDAAVSTQTSPAAFRRRCHGIADRAASHLKDRFREGLLVGVSFGHTLHYLARALRRQVGRRPLKGLAVFPLLGTLPYLDDPYPMDLTSEGIAYDIMACFSISEDPEQQAIGLSSVPVFLPKQLEPHRNTFEEFFSMLPAFRRIYGDREADNGMIGKADMLLLGAGDMPSSRGEGSRYIRARLTLEGRKPESLARITAGDIGGIFLPKAGLAPAELAEVDEINQRLSGLRIQHLTRCSQKAMNGQTPGVVLLTHGASRAAVVREAVRLGLVNHLIIDDDLGRALLANA